ncbi:hypothetical protein SFRURICE_012879 [Spodoptera frugiperda]|nr:hypothetical protein SFRURICE_012879 [Spodoptera frugiperda]
MVLSTRDVLCNNATKLRSCAKKCEERIWGVSIVEKSSIERIFPYKKHSLAESVSTSAKLCLPMNMIGGSQTHPQQCSIRATSHLLSLKG